MMRTHHEAEKEDDEGGKWVQRERIGFRGIPAIDERWRMTEFRWSGSHGCIEKFSYPLRLDEHAALVPVSPPQALLIGKGLDGSPIHHRRT